MSDNDLKYGISWVPSNANDTTGGQSENYSMNCDKDLIMHEDAEAARDELVRVLNCINSSGTLDYADYCELFNTIERVFDALKSVPHEMSAAEYLKERTRMEVWSAENCNQAILDCDDECCECPYDRVPDCKDEANRPLEAVAIVYAWAREHPERSEEDER